MEALRNLQLICSASKQINIIRRSDCVRGRQDAYIALNLDLDFNSGGVVAAILTDKGRHIVILLLNLRFTRVYILYF